MTRRLLRWVGGKAHMIDRVVPLIRANIGEQGRLISLFYGGGAIEQASGIPAERQIAAEAATELRWALNTIRSDVADEVAWALRDVAHLAGFSRRGYERVRSMQVGPQNRPLRAARFLYLSSFAFNGLYRVNRKGEHNVPPDPARLARGLWALPTKEEIGAVRDLIPGFMVTDWRGALERADFGDVVLADAPYLGGFVSYTADGFPLSEQEALAAALRAAAEKGIAIVAFNSPAARTLYSWPQVEEIPRSGRVSSKGSARGDVAELLITANVRPAEERAA